MSAIINNVDGFTIGDRIEIIEPNIGNDFLGEQGTIEKFKVNANGIILAVIALDSRGMSTGFYTKEITKIR